MGTEMKSFPAVEENRGITVDCRSRSAHSEFNGLILVRLNMVVFNYYLLKKEYFRASLNNFSNYLSVGNNLQVQRYFSGTETNNIYMRNVEP